MKNLTKTTSIANDLQYAGRKQHARIVYIKALNETSKNQIVDGLYSGIFKTQIRKIILDWQGKLYNIDKDIIQNKKWKP